MTEETFISFDNFCKNSKPKKIKVNTRSKDELIAEAQEIEKKCKKGVEKIGTI